jgi:anti-anti-sigma factor
MMELTALPSDGELRRLRVAGDVVMHNLIPPAPHPLSRVAGTDVYAGRVLLDLERITWLDTWGIGWLLSCHKRFLRGGGRLVLHSAPPAIEPALKLLRLDQVLHIATDEAAARRLADMEVLP